MTMMSATMRRARYWRRWFQERLRRGFTGVTEGTDSFMMSITDWPLLVFWAVGGGVIVRRTADGCDGGVRLRRGRFYRVLRQPTTGTKRR